MQKADLNGFVLYDKNSKSVRLQFFRVLIVLSSKAVSVQNENEDIKQTYTRWQNNPGNKENKFISRVFTSEYEKRHFLYPSSSCLTRYEDCPCLLCLFYWFILFDFLSPSPYLEWRGYGWNVFSTGPADSYLWQREGKRGRWAELTSPSVALSVHTPPYSSFVS